MAELNCFPREIMNGIRSVIEAIQESEEPDAVTSEEISQLADKSISFEHCEAPDRPFLIAGADSFEAFVSTKHNGVPVRFVRAVSRLYEAAENQLTELPIPANGKTELLWITEGKSKAHAQYLKVFAELLDTPLEELCQTTDYWKMKKQSFPSDGELLEILRFPDQYDASGTKNQLCSTARLGALVQLMKSLEGTEFAGKPVYMLEDATMALPLFSTDKALFFEIAKRYVCEYARIHGFRYLTLTKTHNIPYMGQIECEIQKRLHTNAHWFLRMPAEAPGKSKFGFLGTRTIPPVGTVSYVVKFTSSTSPMRLDMSFGAWQQLVFCDDQEEQLRRERQLFRDLDFATHDRRCYGYPYPLKAARDKAVLTDKEREVLRRILVNEAARAGLYL